PSTAGGRCFSKVMVNIPWGVPAYSVAGSCGSTASERTRLASIPKFTELQFDPPSVLLNNPAEVAAYIVAGRCGEMTSERMNLSVGRVFTRFQVVAPSVLLNNP